MTTSTALLQPTVQPPVHRGMQHLDRTAFTTRLPLLAARLPANKTTHLVLRLRGIGAVSPDPSEQHRRVLLRTADKAALSQEALDVLEKSKAELVEDAVELPYEYWSSDQILQAVLPEDLLDESPTAFTQVGHIAHLNLRDQYLPHKHLIGQVILDKNKSLRTVVNKLDTIDNVYRNFQMEVLAGDEDFEVEMSEHDVKFRFDFSAVYWNSRLQTEHARLVSTFKPDDVIVDGFAGVGPFAIPAGKKGCAVMASDLNPKSAEALKGNAVLNKVEKNVRASNEDGRAFIRRSVLAIWNDPFPPYEAPLSSRERARRSRAANAAKKAALEAEKAPGPDTDVVQQLAEASLSPPSPSCPSAAEASAPESPAPATTSRPRRLPSHYIMNLPASALTFLDAFNSLFRPVYEQVGEEEVKKAAEEVGGLPVVHCYCFSKEEGEAATKDICERATAALGHTVHPGLSDFDVKFVRDVAPKKGMYVLEFRLTDEMVK